MEKPQHEFQHNRLTSFWKNMLSLIFFLLISMAREEHDDTVDRVAIFRLKCWISRGGSILASSSRQASLRTTNQRITQARIDQSAYSKARRWLYSSWAIPFLNCERLRYRKNEIGVLKQVDFIPTFCEFHTNMWSILHFKLVYANDQITWVCVNPVILSSSPPSVFK